MTERDIEYLNSRLDRIDSRLVQLACDVAAMRGASRIQWAVMGAIGVTALGVLAAWLA